MASWIFEPGHTEAAFRARHMMVVWVCGLFKDVHGRMGLDWERPLETTFEGEIDATRVWTGEPDRDAHLRSADFLDVGNHPRIAFRGRRRAHRRCDLQGGGRPHAARSHPLGHVRRRLPRPVADAVLGGGGEPRQHAPDRL